MSVQTKTISESSSYISYQQDAQAAEDQAQDFVTQEEKARASQGWKSYQKLNKIWQPSFRKTKKAVTYFSNADGDPAYYYNKESIFSDHNPTELLMGVLAYTVQDESVVSFQHRLSEISKLHLYNDSFPHFPPPIALQESFQSDFGEQFLITRKLSDDKQEKEEHLQLEDALIDGFSQLDGVFTGRLEYKQESLQYAKWVVPAEISWDGKEHTAHLSFKVKNRKHKPFTQRLLECLNLTNGRPAQHYQDQAAAVIQLQNIEFAKKGSIRLVIDENTPHEQIIKPDKLWGRHLVMALTQTSGGFFERQFFQPASSPNTILQKRSDETYQKQQELQVSETSEIRETILSYKRSPYQIQYLENKIKIGRNRYAYELSDIKLKRSNSDEIMRISFNTTSDRGLRDLNFKSQVEQKGRFKISINGEDGFSYGDLILSPTQELGNGTYYHSLTLTPHHPIDMKNKKIVIHVHQSEKGIYTQTQVVPLKVYQVPRTPDE